MHDTAVQYLLLCYPFAVVDFMLSNGLSIYYLAEWYPGPQDSVIFQGVLIIIIKIQT